jgi:hypothetical protein
MSMKAGKLFEQLKLDVNTRGKGLIRLFSFDPRTGIIRKMIERENLVLYGGADILAKLLSGDPKYAVNTMYLEFSNIAPAIPSFDRTGGVSYYNGLAADPNVDFLRVPLTVNPVIDSSDPVLYLGNRVTFFGVSEGTTGFHGKTFGPVAPSTVYGAALVAAPDVLDQSQDVVFSRAYAGIGSVTKEAGFEIGVTWTIQFN